MPHIPSPGIPCVSIIFSSLALEFLVYIRVQERIGHSSATVILPVAGVVSAMTMEQVHEGTREKDQIWEEPENMAPVLAQEKEQGDHPERESHPKPIAVHDNLTPFNLSALPITLTDDSAMAAAAMIGERSRPNAG